MLMFKERAMELKFMEENNEVSSNTLKNIGKKIAKKIKEVHRNQNEYFTSFDEENMTNTISPTLSILPLSILRAFIDNFLDENSLPSIMIGNIITNKVTKTYSTLQIALALSIYRKELIIHYITLE